MEAGGKGASLSEMVHANIPVPAGFVVVSHAFDSFMKESGLEGEIQNILDQIQYSDVQSLQRGSEIIQDLIFQKEISEHTKQEIFEVYSKLSTPYVAVRSSATAEDGAKDSWAGELESFLNTHDGNLLENTKKCWASLFTPRALLYRKEKGLHDTRVSVAVVVQKMIQSEIAGVTFTTHPLTEDPNQMIIEAAWGLGEMLVGGEVTPDSYIVKKQEKEIAEVSVGEQEEMLVRGEHGNEKIAVSPSKRSQQKLSATQILELAEICMNIEKHYGFPCDIEWAFEGGKFHIVQSRPITTLGKQ